MSVDPSESRWLRLLKAGDEDAAAELWQRYVHRLMALARRKLGTGPTRVADEEDVVVSAFNSFCRGAAAERFADLHDRNDLWQVLAMLTTRKAIRQLQRQRAAKRGGGDVRGESAFSGASGIGIHDVTAEGPTPEVEVMLNEQFESLLDRLPENELRQIALARLEGYSNDDIAARFGRHVRSIERKLRLIREYWKDYASD